MAATGYSPIYLYYSSTTTNVPLAANLGYGELAINIADGKLFYKDNTDTVQVLAGKGGTGVVAGSNTEIQYNNSGVFGASSNFTFDGSNLYVSNRIGVGIAATVPIEVYGTTGGSASIVSNADGINGPIVQLRQYQDAAVSPYVYFTKFRGSKASPTIVQSGDALGELRFAGYDGTQPRNAANIYAYVDGAPTAGTTMPGRLVFSTAAATGSSTERVRIGSSGLTTLGYSSGSGAALSATNAAFLQVASSTYTDTATAASGTVTLGGLSNILAPTLAATNASVTYTNAATLYVGGAVAAGSNVTITNPYSLYVNSGTAYFGGNVGIGQQASTVPLHTYKTSSVQAIFEQTGGTQNFIVLRNTGSTGNNIRVTADNTDLTLYTAGAEKLRLFNSGGLSLGNTTDPGSTNLSVTGTGKFGTTVGVGAATPAASGVGITFPSTQSLSTDVNTLDDYREGTFTATGTGFSDATPPSGTATYVKVGNMVMIYLPQISGTSNATTFTVTGMPSTLYPSAARTTYAQARDNNGAFVGIKIIIGSSGTITLYKNYDNGAWTASGSKILAACMTFYLI